MNVSKTPAIILGILTFLPFLGLLAIFALVVFEIIILLFSDTPFNLFLYLSYLNYIVPILSGFLIIYVGLGIFYFVHIIQNKFLDREKKILWVVVLISLNGLAMPFYWYMYLWKNNLNEEQTIAKAW